MTMPFLPNEADATYEDQAEPDSVDFEILLAGHQLTGVVSGFIVQESTTPAQTIDVGIGVGRLLGKTITVSSMQDNTAITAAHATLPRIDLISINSSGTAVVTAGTAAAQPVCPAVPASSIAIATLYVPANDNTHVDEQIVDKRVFIPAASAGEYAGAHTLDETDNVVNMESTAATRAVTLPDNATYAGKSFLIRRDGSNTVTVTRAGSDTFDDAATSKSLDTDGASIGIFSIGDGEWKIVGTNGTVT